MSSPNGIPQIPAGLSSDPKHHAAQVAMLKLLSTPPERIIDLFDRLEIPWERTRTDDGTPVFVVKWDDLMAGETRNQAEGPFIKKILAELKEELGGQLPTDGMG